MFHFELELAKFMKEMQQEREAVAKQKAEQQRSKEAQEFVRNTEETKTQTNNKLGNRGASSR